MAFLRLRWFSAFLRLRANVLANAKSLAFFAAAALGDSFCFAITILLHSNKAIYK